MNATWHGDAPPPMPPIGAMGWVGVLVKLPLLGIVVFGGLALLLLVRLIERPLCGLNRPVTPHITVFVCRLSLGILGIVLGVKGRIDPHASAVVANHSSWLDIFVLNARQAGLFRVQIRSRPLAGDRLAGAGNRDRFHRPRPQEGRRAKRCVSITDRSWGIGSCSSPKAPAAMGLVCCPSNRRCLPPFSTTHCASTRAFSL